MPLLLLSEQTLKAKVQQPQSLPYLRCNIPKNCVPQGAVTGSSVKGGWKSRRDHTGPGESVRAL